MTGDRMTLRWRYVEPNRITVVAALLLLGLSDCRTDVTTPTQPAGGSTVEPVSQCSAECTFYRLQGRFAMGHTSPDSVGSLRALARFTIHGHTGDAIVVRTVASASIREQAGSAALVVTAGHARNAYPLADLPDSLVVYRFVSDTTIYLSYALKPSAAKVGTGVLQFRQQLAGATVVSSVAPYAPPASASAMEEEGYELDAGTGNDSDVSWLISPYADGSYWDELAFQSDTGVGASSRITLTFDKPIAKAVIEIFDPTYAGNYAAAYDTADTETDSVAFTYSGEPGNNIPDIDSLTGQIHSIVLNPADSDYVAYVVYITLSTDVRIVISFLNSPPLDSAGEPQILPRWSAHTNQGATLIEPLPRYNNANWPASLRFTVRIDSAGRTVPDRTIDLLIDAVDDSGQGADAVFSHVH